MAAGGRQGHPVPPLLLGGGGVAVVLNVLQWCLSKILIDMPKVKGKVPLGVESITIRGQGTELVVEPTQPTQQQATGAPSVAPSSTAPDAGGFLATAAEADDLSDDSLEHDVTPSQPRVVVRKVSEKRMRMQQDNENDFVNTPFKKKKSYPPPRRSPRGHATVGERGAKRKDAELPVAKKASKVVVDVKPNAKAGKEKLKYTTCRSAPHSIVELIKSIPKALRNRLVKNGFGDFLKFSLDEIIDRQLLCFLMDHVDVGKMQIDLGHDKVIRIDEHAVQCVLGLPNDCELDPPVYKSSRDKEYLQELKQILNIAADKDVSRVKILGLAAKHDVDDMSVTYFFICVVNMLLFPTAKNNIRGMDYLWSREVDTIWKVDWRKAVVDFLKEKVQIWQSNPKRKMDPDGSTSCIQGCAIFLLILYLDHLLCDNMIQHKDLHRSAFFNSTVVGNISQADKITLKDATVTYGGLKFRNLKGTCYWLHDHHISSPIRASVIRPDTTSVRPAKLKKPLAKVTRDKAANEGCSKGDPLFLRLEPLLGKTLKYAGPEMHKQAVTALGDFDAMLSKGDAMVVEGHKMVLEGQNMMTQGNLIMTDGQQIILKAQEDIVAKIKRIEDVATCQRKKKAGQTTSTSVPMCTPPSEDEAEELEAHVTTMSDPIVPITEPTSAAVVPSAGMHHDDNTGHASPAPSIPTACAASAPTGGGNEEARNFDHSFGDDAQPGIAVGDDAADLEPSEKISQESNISQPPVLQPPEESWEKGQEDRAKLSVTAASTEQGATNVASPAPHNADEITKNAEVIAKQVNDLTIEDSSQSSLGGVNNRDFDWARWAHVAQATREHDTDDSQKDVHCDKHDPKVSDDASLDAAKVVGNPEHVEQRKQRFTKAHYLRNKIVSRKIKNVEKLGEETRTLGQRLRTVPARYSPKSPFVFWKKWRSDPCLEEAEAVYYSIFDLDDYQSTVYLELPDEHISLTGSQILDQFSQGNMIEDDVITFFLTCLVHDERTSRPSSAGYRVFLDPTVLEMLLSEDYGTSSIFEVQNVIHVLQERYKLEQFINATHVNRDAYHARICVRLRDRLHEVLKLFTKGRITDFSDFGWPYVPMPIQAEGSNDCGILMMLGLEFYDPDSRKTRKIRYEIRPEDGMDYRVKILYYMMFYQVNCAKRPFPKLIEEKAPKAVPFPTLDDDAPAAS
ncbi:hypothetical protein ACP4OV_021350 [Aristida adscensionis]